MDDRVYEISGSQGGEDESFSDVAPCSLVEDDRHFRGAYCPHHQGDEVFTSEMSVYFKETTGTTSQKAAMLMIG
jgi:hypothetical protein